MPRGVVPAAGRRRLARVLDNPTARALMRAADPHAEMQALTRGGDRDDDNLQPPDDDEAEEPASYDGAAALATVGDAKASLVDFVRRRLGDSVNVDLAKLVENGLMGEEEVLDQPYGSRSWIEFADALENHCGPKKKTRGDHARRRK